MKKIFAYGPLLRTEIRKVIADEQAKTRSSTSWQIDFLKRLSPYATGGKLVRGSLVCFSYQAFSNKSPDKIVIDAAIALELIHSALLIHDDVMDNDDFRRGKPSMHRQYQKLARRQSLAEPDRFGVNMAVCGADMCIFMAFGLLAGAREMPIANQLVKDILIEVCDGQMQDIYSQASPDINSKRMIYNLMRAKTASYTLSLPLAFGAALAGQPENVIKKLRQLGDAAGTIFQIRDDELGILGDKDKTGKPVGADIREGKKTLIYYYLLKTCNRREKQALHEIFGNPNLKAADVAMVRSLIKKRRVDQLIGNDIQKLEIKANAILNTLTLARRDKAELASLIRFCAKRQT